MIGKLIKNEFKHGIHSMSSIYFAAIASIAILAIGLIFDLKTLTALSIIAAFFVAIAVVLVTMIVTINNFNKTLYRDQGYLTFTLPVKSGSILFAKTLAAFVWMIISYLLLIGIIAAVSFYAMDQVGEESIASIKTILVMIKAMPEPGTVATVITIMAIAVFLKLVMLIAEIYFAVTLSNVRPFQRQSLFPAVIIFVVVYLVLQVLNLVLTTYAPLSIVVTMEGITLTTSAAMIASGGLTYGIAGMAFELVMAAVLLVSTVWFMNHKVNIK